MDVPSRVLGHVLPPATVQLLRDVRQRFPQKALLIHPFDVAEQETGSPMRANAKAVSRPQCTQYIAIWINHRLPTAEFNATLSEELYHHLQAGEGWSVISSCAGIDQTVLQRNVAALKDFSDRLMNCLWDIGAHRALAQRGVDITPLLDDQLLRVTQAMDGLTPEIRAEFRDPTRLTYSAFFEQYLLNALDFSLPAAAPYQGRWLPARQTLQSLPPPNVLAVWERIERDLTANPIDGDASFRRAASMITSQILHQLPGLTLGFEKMPVAGKTLNLKLAPLVPTDPV